MSANEYLAALKRRKWSLALPVIMATLIAAAVALSLSPIYKSVATILIEEPEIPSNYVTSTVTRYAEQRLQSINQRIMSTSRLLEIINRLDLYRELRHSKTTEKVIAAMRDDIRLAYISADLADRKTGRPASATIAFTLSYEAAEPPATVQKVANVLCSLFLEENLQVRERQAMEATSFLGDEQAKVKASLEEIEQQIAAFKGEHINELPENLQMNLQSRHNLETAQDSLTEQLRALKEREGALQSQLTNVPPQLKMDDLKKLKALKHELNSLETRFTDQYPDVILLKQEIDKLSRKLAGESNAGPNQPPDNPAYIALCSQLAGVRAEIESVKRQYNDLQKRGNTFGKWIAATPQVEEAYNGLLLERKNRQAKFEDLSQKLMEANIAYGLEKEQKGERFTLIDPAQLPEQPNKPNRLAILLIGVGLGVAAGVATAALQEFRDEAVRSPEMLTRATHFPVLAAIPRIISPQELRRERIHRRWILLAVAGSLVALTLLAGHLLAMDLHEFWTGAMHTLSW